MPSGRIVRIGGTERDAAALLSLMRRAGMDEPLVLDVGAAEEAIAARTVDCVLLDLQLNSNDVFSILRAAAPQRGGSRIPVIVTANQKLTDRIQACLERGAEDYLFTPFDDRNPLLVTRPIELALNRRKLRDFTVRFKGLPKDPNETAVMQMASDAARRFVPKEFLDILGRSALTDVQLGDHVARSMTIFFSDIRDFTLLSERLTPQQNFNFLNSYLRQVTPVVRAHHGFVDKYIGDAIMALFPREPLDALKAAVELQQQVVRYNAGRLAAGYVPISIGIGLHHGDLILGTIGEEERLQTTVIADAVNVASRIEGLTKVFGTGLLISGAIVDALPDDHGFKLRGLGAVKAKGKSKSVNIYECFDNDLPEMVEHKLKTLDLFERGMHEFQRGYFISAWRAFAPIAEKYPQDTAAAYFRDRCTLTAVRDRGQTPWDGAEVIEVK